MPSTPSSLLSSVARAFLAVAGVTLLATPGSATAAETPVPQKLAYEADAPVLHPNLAPGLGVGRRFDVDAPAAVNLFNGNLVLTLPLGLRYPVSESLGYQAVLHYNSAIWSFDAAGEAEPTPWSNAGLGFDLSFGRLLAPSTPENPTSRWLYVSPDGAPHLFYSSLHHDTPDTDDPGDDVLYTRDSTYLRLKTLGSTTRRLERGDGTFDDFSLIRGTWRLTRRGQLGDPDSMRVAYAADDMSWTITDDHGRVHTVTFTADATGTYPRLVSSIDLAAFGGQRSVWTFTYTTASIARACTDPRGGSASVPLLASITEPEGYVRTYEHVPSGCTAAGRLQRAKLSTGGFLEWSYGTYPFPQASCTGMGAGAHLGQVTGVVSRSLVLPNGTVKGTWTYTASPSGTCGAWERPTKILTPRGDRTVQHFSFGMDRPELYSLPIDPTTADSTGTRFLSRSIRDCAADGTSCTTLRKIYERYEQDEHCTSLTGRCWDTNRRRASWRTEFLDDVLADGTKRRADVDLSSFDGLGKYRYRVEVGNYGDADWTRREVGYNIGRGVYNEGGGGSFTMLPTAQTWMLDDYSYRSVETSVSDRRRSDHCFDNNGRELTRRQRQDASAAGHHDLVTSFTWSGRNRITEARAGGDVQWVSDAAICSLVPPPPQFRFQSEYQHGVLSARFFLQTNGSPVPGKSLDRTIDPSTGLVAVERDVSGLGTSFEYDRLARETYRKPESGAWVQTVHRVPNGGSSWSNGPGTTQYTRPNGGGTALDVRWTWSDPFGHTTGSQVTLPDGTKSRRRAEFDAQGDLRKTAESFDPATGLSWRHRLDLDPFGRPRVIRPETGSQHDIVIEYLGDRETRTTSQAGYWFYASSGTCAEDDMAETVVRDRQGREVLRKVERARPFPAVVRETITEYDASGDVVELLEQTTVGSTITAKQRTFRRFDDRGLLDLQWTNDHDNRVVDRLDYGEYDAMGNPGRTNRRGYTLPYPGVTTVTSYDAAGRVVEIADADDPTDLWKQFVYGASNVGADRRLGRLVTARRWNPFAGVRVDDTYVYGGVGGEVSEHLLEIVDLPNGGNYGVLASWRQTMERDDLGRPVEIGHPTCEICRYGEPPLARTLQLEYTPQTTAQSGLPLITGLSETLDGASATWIDSVEYGVAARPTRVAFSNGVDDLFEPDPSGMPRDRSWRTLGAQVDETYGPIVYDGRGSYCGVGGVKATPEPEEVAPIHTWDIECLDAIETDPFGRETGDITDPACRDSMPRPVFTYDAQDRRIAVDDKSARKKIFYQGEWIWVADTDRMTRNYRLYGFDGRVVREVTHGLYANSWWSTTDTVYGPRESRIEQKHTAGSTPPETRYVHTTALQTNPSGAKAPVLD